jgi:sugar O-acyltransferase (sialic acid O-acetyltransferase NeuD family)
MAEIVIFGAGQSAAVARVYIESYSDHRVVGFTVDEQYATADCFDGLPLVAWPRLEGAFPPGQVQLLGPISYARMNGLRRDRFQEGKARGYRFASFIHPSNHISNAEIGEHCYLLEANIIEPFVKIGNNVVIAGGTHIGHHVVIGDHCFLSGEMGMGARSRLGERCFVAAAAIIRPDVTIGEACVLGFGVAVQKDLPAESVVVRDDSIRIAKFPSSRLRNLM